MKRLVLRAGLSAILFSTWGLGLPSTAGATTRINRDATHHARVSQTDAVPSAVVQSGEQTDPAKITVYVTKTGGKYHRENCRYLSKSKIPMSLKDAAQKYEPCKVCKPPTLPK